MQSVKKGRGRPRIEIDPVQVERLASIQCTDEEIASVLAISVHTLARRKHDDPAFVEALEAGKAKGRATLRRLQWQRAHAGSDTMLIWLGKNTLGQSDDRHELGGPCGGPIEMVVTGVRRAADIEGEAIEVQPETDVATGVQRAIEDDAVD